MRRFVPILALAVLAAFPLPRTRAQAPEEPRVQASPGDLSAFREEIRIRARERSWVLDRDQITMDRTILSRSAEAARAYYLSHQKPEGNFVYEHDIVLNTMSDEDSQVRQAGALWGLASLNRDRPTNATARGVIRGLDFWFLLGKPTRMGQIAPLYPGEERIKTGTIALLSLAVIELLRGEEQYIIGKGLLENWLSCYLGYLGAMEMNNGSWGQEYYPEENRRIAEGSPYFDGEALLAYCKAARYAGRKDLIPKIETIAPILARRYTTEEWIKTADSSATKGFSQWGCMAFAEYVEAGWKDADMIADAAMALAWWQIHHHRVPLRRGNTGYAIEGLLGAYRVAKVRGDRRAMQRIREVVEEMLYNLTTWQVGGPLADRNPFLRNLARTPDTAFGGIMDTETSGKVRIDVVQHQLHAVLMALELLYPDAGGEPKRPPEAGLPLVPALTREKEETIRIPGPKPLPEDDDEDR